MAELADLARDAGLEIAGFIEPWRYDPASYLTDAGLLHRLNALDAVARAGFAEQLAGNLKRHIVYLVRRGRAKASVARPDDRAMVPVLRAGSAELVGAMRGRSTLKVAIDGLELRFPIPPHAAEILAAIDGTRSIADIHQALSDTVDGLKSWTAFKPAFDRLYHTFNRSEPAVPDAHSALARHTLPFFSITRMRATPSGWATCSSPGSAWQMSPGCIACAVLAAGAALMHGERAVQQHQHFRAVIDVPEVRPVRPMQPNGRAFDLGDRQGIPGCGGGKVTRCYKLHGAGV